MPDTHVEHEIKVVRPAPAVEPVPLQRRPTYQAYRILHFGFTVLPIIAGLDKFFHWLASWEMYLSTPLERILPFAPQTFMRAVGVIEIVAGVLVAFAPGFGAWVVAAWLLGITINLVLPPGFYDIALRDFGLMLGAISLGLMARRYRK